MAIATDLDRQVYQLDIKLAYLNELLPGDSRVFVNPPSGYEIDDGHCWQLKKSLFGLEKAGSELCAQQLLNIGLHPTETEKRMYTKDTRSGKVMTVLYADALFVVTESEEALVELKRGLGSVFNFEHFSPITEYLGVEFKAVKGGYLLSWKKYLNALLKEFSSYEIKPREIPVKEDVEESKPAKKSDALTGRKKEDYEKGVRGISWAAKSTRPDIALAANLLTRNLTAPTDDDFEALLYCLGYISTTTEGSLVYDRNRKQNKRGEFLVETYSSASFTPKGNIKLISGMIAFFNRNSIMWQSKAEEGNITSTKEAESVARPIAQEGTMYLASLLLELDYEVEGPKIYVS